jgi:hypothetical protein
MPWPSHCADGLNIRSNLANQVRTRRQLGNMTCNTMKRGRREEAFPSSVTRNLVSGLLFSNLHHLLGRENVSLVLRLASRGVTPSGDTVMTRKGGGWYAAVLVFLPFTITPLGT